MIIFDKIEEISRNYYNVSISVVHKLEDTPIKKEYKDIKATTEEELKRTIVQLEKIKKKKNMKNKWDISDLYVFVMGIGVVLSVLIGVGAIIYKLIVQ